MGRGTGPPGVDDEDLGCEEGYTTKEPGLEEEGEGGGGGIGEVSLEEV